MDPDEQAWREQVKRHAEALILALGSRHTEKTTFAAMAVIKAGVEAALGENLRCLDQRPPAA